MNVVARIGALSATLLVLCLLPAPAAAAVDLPRGDGWYRWQTTSVATAADACCHTWRNGRVERCTCDLDDRRNGLSIDTGMVGDDRQIRVYVKLANGAVVSVRALNADCPVNTSTPIVDLGDVAPADSIAWLRSRVNATPRLAEDAISAIGVHGGDDGMRALVSVIENRGLPQKLREHALFWLAQSDSDDAFDYLDNLLSRR